jgi:hypothetical protein
VQSTSGRREIVAKGRRVTIRTDRVGERDVTIVEDLPAASRPLALPASALSLRAR